VNSILWNCLRKITFWEGARVKNKFIQASQHFEATQKKVLIQKIHKAQTSLFGKKHHFDQIHSVDDFRRLVPLSTYDEMAPYINKVRQGDVGALFPQNEKILMYALSSGTTAEPKTIPVTRDFLSDYKRGSFIWGMMTLHDHPKVLSGKILTIVSPSCEELTDSGIPCGAISGLIVETQKLMARKLYAVPRSVCGIKDVETRDYMMLRFALAEDVSFVTTANPSTLIRLARSADKFKEQLVKDIYEGTLTPPSPVKKEWVEDWKPQLAPRKREGLALQNLIQTGKPFRPKTFWPGLAKTVMPPRKKPA